MSTIRHQPARDMTALEHTAALVLGNLSSTPFYRDDSPEFLSGLALARAHALWDALDRQAEEGRAAGLPDAEDEPSASDLVRVEPPAHTPLGVLCPSCGGAGREVVAAGQPRCPQCGGSGRLAVQPSDVIRGPAAPF